MTTKKEIDEAVFRAQVIEKLSHTGELLRHTNESLKEHMDEENNQIQSLEHRIERLNSKIECLNEDKIPQILVEISSLKIKSSLWGGAAGLIISIITVIALIASNY